MSRYTKNTLIQHLNRSILSLFVLLSLATFWILLHDLWISFHNWCFEHGFLFSERGSQWLKSLIEWIGGIISTLGSWNYLIAFLSACIESLPVIGTAVPGMNIMILVGGWWWGDHYLPTVVLAMLGAMLGNYVGYWIGHLYGREIIDRYGDYIGLGRTESRILEWQIQKNGLWYIILGKFHNFTRSFVPFLAGASGMSESRFWLYNMIGSALWSLSIISLGVLFIDHYESILEHFGKITTVLLIGGAVYLWYFKRDSLKQYWREKQAEIEEKSRR